MNFGNLLTENTNKKKNEPIFEMEFYGKTLNGPADINPGWKQYFQQLYKATQNCSFNFHYLSKCDKELKRNFRINGNCKFRET